MTKARTLADNYAADISGITAGTGITGGGTSGTVTITNDMATTIAAKGDLVVGTGNDAYAALTAGSNGDTLVADSAASTGLRWSSTPANSNPLLNSDFSIWQRGTSVSIASATKTYAADRWWFYQGNSTATVSRQATGDTTNIPNIQYGCRYQRNSGQTGTNALYMQQSLETVNSVPFAGKTITLSFYAKRGANFSSASNALSVSVNTGTGTDQDGFGGYTGNAVPINTTVTLTTSYQRFSATGTFATNITEFQPVFYFTPSGTAGADDWFEITGVQFDIGSVALPYRRAMNTLAGELAACQRYYVRFTASTTYNFFNQGGFYNSTTNYLGNFQFPTQMRTNPSSVDYSTLRVVNSDNNAYTVSNVLIGDSGPLNASCNITTGTATNNRYAIVGANNSTSAYIAFNAEL